MSRFLRFAGLLVAVALALGAVAPAGAGPPKGSVGVRLLDAPVDRADDPRAKLYIVDFLAPGATISRRIEVSNGTDAEQLIKLYPGVAKLDQGNFIALPKKKTSDLVTWTTVDPTEVTIPAGESAIATVTIAVPPTASAGERYGAVWAELPPNTSNGVTEVNRVGIRMYIAVGEGGEPATDFTIGKLKAGHDNAGNQAVGAPIVNTGGRAIDVTGQLQLTKGVTTVGPLPASTVTLAPGQSGLLTVAIRPATTRGPWNAQLDAASGQIEHTAKGRVKLLRPAKKVGEPPQRGPDWIPAGVRSGGG